MSLKSDPRVGASGGRRNKDGQGKGDQTSGNPYSKQTSDWPRGSTKKAPTNAGAVYRLCVVPFRGYIPNTETTLTPFSERRVISDFGGSGSGPTRLARAGAKKSRQIGAAQSHLDIKINHS
jgi:hypothetical protein